MNSLIIISTPAGGKGTISNYIETNYNYDHISVGDLLRDEVENNTDIGYKIKNTLDNGNLVSSEILFSLLRKKLKNQKKNFILDGTPRILCQAKIYDSLLEKLNITLSKVIFIKTDKEIAKSRMLDRFVCEYCNESYSLKKDGNICLKCKRKLTKRNDDNIKIFKKRYETFINKTLPVIEYYEKKGLVFTISNNNSIDDTFKQVDKIMRRQV